MAIVDCRFFGSPTAVPSIKLSTGVLQLSIEGGVGGDPGRRYVAGTSKRTCRPRRPGLDGSGESPSESSLAVSPDRMSIAVSRTSSEHLRPSLRHRAFSTLSRRGLFFINCRPASLSSSTCDSGKSDVSLPHAVFRSCFLRFTTLCAARISVTASSNRCSHALWESVS